MRLYKISADLDILNVRNTYSEISKDEFYKLTYNELLEIKEYGYLYKNMNRLPPTNILAHSEDSIIFSIDYNGEYSYLKDLYKLKEIILADIIENNRNDLINKLLYDEA